MDISKIKNAVQNIFKNYSSLLVPAAIGLFAMLLLIPTQLMSSKLRAQIADESISRRGKKIQSLSRNPVARRQWEEEQKYQQAYADDANTIALLAKESTERELLSYKIFPEPKDKSSLIFGQFGRQFRKSIDKLLSRLRAGGCPTDAELERGLEGLSTAGGSRWSRLGKKGSSYSRLSEARATVEDVLCREKAKSASVYANSANLSGYEFWREYEAKSWADAIRDCWYWQLGYWITEDIINTIDVLNSGSKSVLTSPVKQLLDVSFTRGGRISRSSAGAQPGTKTTNGRPKYVISIGDAFTMPCTARLSNESIDVVHFKVSVVVSTKAILPFMQQLCSVKQHKFRGWDGREQEQVFKHNQITILETKIKSIDRKDDEHRLYRYGDDAVVELDLICEYIFNKAGYEEVKPNAVKEALAEEQKKLQEQKKKAEIKKRIKSRRKKRSSTKTKLGVQGM